MKLCVLTGASGFLGTAFIHRHSWDYKIIAVHNTREIAPAAKFVDPLNPFETVEHPAPITIRADLSKPKVIDRLCRKIVKEHGGIDLLINAACHRDWHLLTADGALDEAEHSYVINVLAPIRLTVGFAREFWTKQSCEENTINNRNVINISSTAGSFVYPDSGQAIYSSTKAALNYASYHLASELFEYGVRVNTVAPNTFPHIVSTEEVLDALYDLSNGIDTGELKLLDRHVKSKE